MTLPKAVKLVEVGPRDGLQNEKKPVPTATKVAFINQLAATGLAVVEVTSFVSPKWIPQLADNEKVYQTIIKPQSVDFPVLVPNVKGMQHAIACGVQSIAVFTSPSEAFCKKNINCSVQESLESIAEVIKMAKDNQIKVRGYLSCVLGCPYQGQIEPQAVAKVAQQLLALGCYEISLGDTIGVGTPQKAQALFQAISATVPMEQLAAHFHDTYGQALANLYAVLQLGVATIDCSVSGLGGCPYAEGASGNVATEDVLYLLNGLNIKTGVDLPKLIECGRFICNYLNQPSRSKVNQAFNSTNIN